MKIVNSHRSGKQKYTLTMTVTDTDIELFEDLATCYVTAGLPLFPNIQKGCKQWFHELWKHCWKKFA